MFIVLRNVSSLTYTRQLRLGVRAIFTAPERGAGRRLNLRVYRYMFEAFDFLVLFPSPPGYLTVWNIVHSSEQTTFSAMS